MSSSLHVQYPLFLSSFNEINFLDSFFYTQISNFMKTCLVGAESLTYEEMDRWTDMAKLIVTFLTFANAPKNS